MRIGNDKLSTGLDNPDVDVTYDVIAETISTNVPIIAPPALPATTPATTPANKPATSLATAPATAPARPKPVKEKKQFTAPFPIPLSELKVYVSKKKKETYKEGNGFLFDYEVSYDNNKMWICLFIRFINCFYQFTLMIMMSKIIKNNKLFQKCLMFFFLFLLR